MSTDGRLHQKHLFGGVKISHSASQLPHGCKQSFYMTLENAFQSIEFILVTNTNECIDM